MTFDFMVAQLAHIAWAALIYDALVARMKWYKALAILVAFFVGKECIESIWGVWEPVQPWSSGLWDMLFWTLGIPLGVVLGKWERIR